MAADGRQHDSVLGNPARGSRVREFLNLWSAVLFAALGLGPWRLHPGLRDRNRVGYEPGYVEFRNQFMRHNSWER